jgi:soluble lytic murein transglycosylase
VGCVRPSSEVQGLCRRALEGVALAAARTPRRPRLLLLVAASLCAAVGGVSAEIWLLPRAVPKPEMPLQDRQPRLLTVSEADEILRKVGPSLPADLRQKIAAALVSEGRRNGYDPLFLMALIGVESRYRLGAESGRGARGLAQLKPSTFAWISAREPDVGGEDLESGDDPVVDIRLSARYFRWLEHRFGSRDGALIAYNAGPRNAARARKGAEVPERWKAYPQLVKKEYERLLAIAAGKLEPAAGPLLARLDQRRAADVEPAAEEEE